MLLFMASLTLAVRLRQNTFRKCDFAPCIRFALREANYYKRTVLPPNAVRRRFHEDAFKMGRNRYIHSVAVNSNILISGGEDNGCNSRNGKRVA